jgi:aminoglycoside N3'-acetyltransferase
MTLEKKINEAVKKINLKEYDTIYVAGNIYNFGFSFNETKLFCENLINNLLIITKNKINIVVPTSTLDLLKKKNPIFSNNTKSFMMGIFSEFVRSKKESFRSSHPLWSFSGIGKDIKDILNQTSCSAYGKGSVFEKLLKKKTLFVSMGKPHRSLAMLHYAEHVVGVPYRFNKEFNIKVKTNNKIRKKYCLLGVRYNSKKIIGDGNKKIINKLIKKKIFNIIKLNKGNLYCADYNSLVNELINILNNNPKIWLKNESISQNNYTNC